MATFFIGVIVTLLLNLICLGLMISSSRWEKEEEKASRLWSAQNPDQAAMTACQNGILTANLNSK